MIDTIKRIISSLFVEPVYQAPESSDLKDTVVVITGASRGIGKAIAEVLMREEASVAVMSRSRSDLEKVYQDDKKVLLLEGDVTNEKNVEKMIHEVIEQFGKIDVLINNAGSFLDKPLDEITEKEYDRIMDTNVKGAFLMSREVLPLMKKRKEGLIINIGSKISHNTNVAATKVMYATTKYAIEGFSFALNKELKPHGVRVSCLMPGTVNTFVSLKSKQYMPPFALGSLILMLIKHKEIDFEAVVFKSRKQDL
ncbi:MAG: hypothetical protein RI947_842 [Candidatus Parcubacteria bacterium]|jgi:NAD(P)-dependent dehydrogenase (short-subunit alcohol dehydrogenase family)